ncbi:MAG: hypothetical protein AcusKO_27950 [Acuticoccus sp.]
MVPIQERVINVEPEHDSNLIDLAAEIVSAYVSNNSVSSHDLPNLISDVYAALQKTNGVEPEPEPEPLKPAVSIKKSIHARLSDLPRRRQEVQVAEAPSSYAL